MSTDDQGQPPSGEGGGVVRTDWFVVLAAVGAGIVGAAHIGKVPAALPAIRAEFGLDLVLAGWVVSMFSATGMLAGMAVGVLADRLGHRALALAGVALMGAGSALGALAGDGATLLATRFFEGVGFVIAVVTAPSLIVRAVARAHRRFVFGLWGSFMSMGLAAMLVASPPVLEAWGWRGAWLTMAAVSVLWALLMLFALRRFDFWRGAPPVRAHPWKEVIATARAPGPWLLAVCFGCYALAWTALMVWLPTFLVDQRASGLGFAAGLTVLVVIVNFPGNVLGGWLNQRGLPRWALLLFVGVLFAVLGPLLFLDWLPDGARLAAALAFSCLGGILPASVLGAAPVFAPGPAQIGATNGLLVQGSNLGQFVGPPLVGAAVSAAGGWQGGAWVFLACGLGVVLFALAIRRAEARL